MPARAAARIAASPASSHASASAKSLRIAKWMCGSRLPSASTSMCSSRASTDATVLEWLGAFGLLALFALALTWIAVGMGMASPNAEAASNMAMPLILLPLISSAFIPADTMPGWFRPIAEYQPFTPAIETLRGLLLGTEIGNNWWIAILWCIGLSVLGYRWAMSQFNRDAK